MTDQHNTRAQLVELLDGGHAHMSFDDAIAGFPARHRNTRPPNVPYSFWHLLEHMRIANRDLLDYMASDDYRELPWPDAHWPARDADADPAQWDATIDALRDDLSDIRAIVADPSTDLDAAVRNAGGNTGHTVARTVLSVADHTAYHLGEFAILRQVAGAWPEGRTP